MVSVDGSRAANTAGREEPHYIALEDIIAEHLDTLFRAWRS